MQNCYSLHQLHWELIEFSLVELELYSAGLASLKLWPLPIPWIISKGDYSGSKSGLWLFLITTIIFNPGVYQTWQKYVNDLFAS